VRPIVARFTVEAVPTRYFVDPGSFNDRLPDTIDLPQAEPLCGNRFTQAIALFNTGNHRPILLIQLERNQIALARMAVALLTLLTRQPLVAAAPVKDWRSPTQ